MRIPPGWRPQRQLRLWLIAMSLVASALTGTIIWELVNPVTMTQRALVFGVGSAWTVMLAVFFFDMLVSRRGWCGHLCPVGAFYGLLGRFSALRVSATNRESCTDCGDCFEACPEPQVIAPALHGRGPPVATARLDRCQGRNKWVCSNDLASLLSAETTNHALATPEAIPYRTLPDESR